MDANGLVLDHYTKKTKAPSLMLMISILRTKGLSEASDPELHGGLLPVFL